MWFFPSFAHCLPNILHTWPHDSFQVTGDTTVNDLGHISTSLDCFTSNFSKNGVWYGKSYYRQLIGNHTLAFNWCHFWWPWSTFEGHFSLGCHFHVHCSYPWHAFASHGLQAIAELLVVIIIDTLRTYIISSHHHIRQQITTVSALLHRTTDCMHRPDWCQFLPCDAMSCTVLVIVILSVRLSVCPSVCLSHSCTVSTWFDLRSWFLHHMVAPSF